MLDEMHCFRYKLNHDYGLAPNPFGGVMTLAVCKGIPEMDRFKGNTEADR